MKLALYLPNFRDKITIEEIDDLAAVAEELDFDSLWTLDRIVVPEASDQQKLEKPFGAMKEFPNQLPVSARGEWLQGPSLIPYLAATTKKIRLGVSIIVTAFRAPTVMAAEIATWDHLSRGRINVGVGSGWMPEEFQAASAAHIYPKRNKHVRETIEVMQGIWTNELFEYDGEFSSFQSCGFGAKPVQKPRPPMYFSGLVNPETSAKRVAKYGLEGWIGIMDTRRTRSACGAPRSAKSWRRLGHGNALETPRDLEHDAVSRSRPGRRTRRRTASSRRRWSARPSQITENLIKPTRKRA